MALYDYAARNSDELSFTRGATIYLAPLGKYKNRHRELSIDALSFRLAMQSTTSQWFLGSVDRIHTGLIPANYVQPLRQVAAASNITLHPQTPYNTMVRCPNVALVFVTHRSMFSVDGNAAASTSIDGNDHATFHFHRRRATNSDLINDFRFVLVT